MNKRTIAAPRKRRDDLIVSVCFPDFERARHSEDAVKALARDLDEHFRYWEILLVITSSEVNDLEGLLAEIGNARAVLVRRTADFYLRRVIAANEAIGDVVALAAVEELAAIDLVQMIEQASAGGWLVVAERSLERLFEPLLVALGRLSGFQVSTRAMRSTVFTRPILQQCLAHPEQRLALRFPPSEADIVVRPHLATHKVRRPRGEVRHRLFLVQRLLINSAPSVLGWISSLSILMTVGAGFYFIYAVVVWAVAENVQAGWFTLSVVLSTVGVFIGIAFFGIATSLQRLLEATLPYAADAVVGERSNVDLFQVAMDELNVDVDRQDRPDSES